MAGPTIDLNSALDQVPQTQTDLPQLKEQANQNAQTQMDAANKLQADNAARLAQLKELADKATQQSQLTPGDKLMDLWNNFAQGYIATLPGKYATPGGVMLHALPNVDPQLQSIRFAQQNELQQRQQQRDLLEKNFQNAMGLYGQQMGLDTAANTARANAQNTALGTGVQIAGQDQQAQQARINTGAQIAGQQAQVASATRGQDIQATANQETARHNVAQEGIETEKNKQTANLAQAQRQFEIGKYKAGQEDNINKDYNDQTKTFTETRDAYGRVIAAGNNPSPEGDLSLLYAYFNLVHPGLATRDTQLLHGEKAFGADDYVNKLYGQLGSGQMLTNAQRLDLIQRANAYAHNANNQLGALNNTYTATAQKLGLDPSRIVMNRDPIQIPDIGKLNLTTPQIYDNTTPGGQQRLRDDMRNLDKKGQQTQQGAQPAQPATPTHQFDPNTGAIVPYGAQ